MTIYLRCYTRDFMEQFGKVDDAIFEVAETRTLIQQQLKITCPVVMGG